PRALRLGVQYPSLAHDKNSRRHPSSPRSRARAPRPARAQGPLAPARARGPRRTAVRRRADAVRRARSSAAPVAAATYNFIDARLAATLWTVADREGDAPGSGGRAARRAARLRGRRPAHPVSQRRTVLEHLPPRSRSLGQRSRRDQPDRADPRLALA